ncbi:DUF2624 family protein [Jeotgalibacillus sp. R-1-5s-1]|uniref:DUF2624 family protein n=1 Tax=Jeotgalibacillus sp. R-1-5s-1 TaxID=2555897 RepID=UPI001069EC27|nr:DUF2624 family protein [Jeotgalibacillus sp. R-1-5s-1]TFD92308.1 DUF2624 family protein [Jeotgalibacillus sp. R-1-5s-1]
MTWIPPFLISKIKSFTPEHIKSYAKTTGVHLTDQECNIIHQFIHSDEFDFFDSSNRDQLISESMKKLGPDRTNELLKLF